MDVSLIFKIGQVICFSEQYFITKESVSNKFCFFANPLHRFTFGYFQLNNRSNLLIKLIYKQNKGQLPWYPSTVAACCDYNNFAKVTYGLNATLLNRDYDCKKAHLFIITQMLVALLLLWRHNVYQKVSNGFFIFMETIVLIKDGSVLTNFKNIENTGNCHWLDVREFVLSNKTLKNQFQLKTRKTTITLLKKM